MKTLLLFACGAAGGTLMLLIGADIAEPFSSPAQWIFGDGSTPVVLGVLGFGVGAGAAIALSIESNGFGTWLRSVLNVLFFLLFIPVLVIDVFTKPLLQNVEDDVGFAFLWVWWRNYRARADARAASRRAERAAARAAAATKTSA